MLAGQHLLTRRRLQGQSRAPELRRALKQLMSSGICQLCGEYAKLVDSHILPEFFYEGTYDESHRFISVTSHPRHRPRPMQRGLTEPLMCSACDTRIGRYESYAATVLRRADAMAGTASDGITLTDIDFTLFRLFGLSLLWRAHIARSYMFSAVKLGPFAARLTAMIHEGDPGEPPEFGFALAKVVGLDTHASMISAPAANRYHGHRVYNFMARGYEWVFVVSGSSDRLRDRFPFVGQDPILCIPILTRDRRRLFANICRAFPRAFGDSTK